MLAHPPSGTTSAAKVLVKAQPGMQVYDILGQRVGKVQYAHLGESTYGSNIQWGYATTRLGLSDYAPDPAEIRLISLGYIKVDRGSATRHGYAYADQVSAVNSAGVFLNVTAEQLFYAL